MAFVVAIITAIIIVAGCANFCIKKNRRSDLRRRIIKGEANLKELGYELHLHSQALIDMLPLYTYDFEGAPAATEVSDEYLQTAITERQQPVADSSNGNGTTEVVPLTLLEPSTSNDVNSSQLPHKFLAYSQPLCTMCLENFVPRVTAIKELPCGHIFHPGCIERRLDCYSPDCPMCKQSVLPRY